MIFLDFIKCELIHRIYGKILLLNSNTRVNQLFEECTKWVPNEYWCLKGLCRSVFIITQTQLNNSEIGNAKMLIVYSYSYT